MLEMTFEIVAFIVVGTLLFRRIRTQLRSGRLGNPAREHWYRAVLFLKARRSVCEAHIPGKSVGWWMTGLVVLEEPGTEIVLYRRVAFFGWWVKCGEYLRFPEVSEVAHNPVLPEELKSP